LASLRTFYNVLEKEKLLVVQMPFMWQYDIAPSFSQESQQRKIALKVIL
jgi:hypothetical protein